MGITGLLQPRRSNPINPFQAQRPGEQENAFQMNPVRRLRTAQNTPALTSAVPST